MSRLTGGASPLRSARTHMTENSRFVSRSGRHRSVDSGCAPRSQAGRGLLERGDVARELGRRPAHVVELTAEAEVVAGGDPAGKRADHDEDDAGGGDGCARARSGAGEPAGGEVDDAREGEHRARGEGDGATDPVGRRRPGDRVEAERDRDQQVDGPPSAGPRQQDHQRSGAGHREGGRAEERSGREVVVGPAGNEDLVQARVEVHRGEGRRDRSPAAGHDVRIVRPPHQRERDDGHSGRHGDAGHDPVGA